MNPLKKLFLHYNRARREVSATSLETNEIFYIKTPLAIKSFLYIIIKYYLFTFYEHNISDYICLCKSNLYQHFHGDN